MKKTRKSYSATEKTPILKRGLVEKVAVSDAFEQFQTHPAVFTAGKRSSLTGRT